MLISFERPAVPFLMFVLLASPKDYFGIALAFCVVAGAVDPQQLLGLDTVGIDSIESAKILSGLRPLFESGMLSKSSIAERYPLIDGILAYQRAASAGGKIVLRMD